MQIRIKRDPPVIDSRCFLLQCSWAGEHHWVLSGLCGFPGESGSDLVAGFTQGHSGEHFLFAGSFSSLCNAELVLYI